MSIHEEATDTVNDEPLRRQSIHNKLSHLGSRHNSSDESRYSGYLTPRNQRISRNDRRRSTIDSTDRFVVKYQVHSCRFNGRK